MAVSSDQIVNRKKNTGTGVYGLYVSFVSISDATHVQAFLAGKMLCVYARHKDFKRAAWKGTVHPSPEDAYEALVGFIKDSNGNSTELTAKVGPGVLLVELSDTDLTALKSSSTPPARFLGTSTMERFETVNLDAPVKHRVW